MRIKFGVAMLLSIAVTACANVPKDFSFDSTKPTGLVVGSVTYESGLGRYHLVVASKDTGRKTLLGFGCAVWPCIQSADDKAFSAEQGTEQRGGGYSVQLPAGTYRIAGWEVARGQMRSRAQVHGDIEFTVEAGRASYLGNLHFDPDWTHVQLRDRADRDLGALRETYAVLRETPLAYRIAEGTVIDDLSGEYVTRLQGPIYIFVSH